MKERPVENRDAIAQRIDIELFTWLTDTAKTAEGTEDLVDLYAGAVAGLSRFVWVMRSPDSTVDGLVARVARDMRSFLEQADDRERGGNA